VTGRRARRLAWAIAGLSLVLIAGSLVLLGLDWPAIDSPFTAQLPWFLNAVIVGVLGALIALRRPHNPIGWLMLAISFGNAINLAADFLAIRALLAGAAPTGALVEWLAWLFSWTGGFGAFLLAYLILFFPDGRLPSRRWRPVLWVSAAAGTILVVASMLSSTPTQLSPRLPNVAYPVNVSALSLLTGSGVGNALLVALLLTPVVAVVVRLRRAVGTERLQLKWFAYVVAGSIGLSVIGFAVGIVNQDVGSLISGAGFDLGVGVVVPATIGLAVMRYGLYDLDLVISRAIVYASLAVFITAVYVSIAVGIGALAGGGGKPNLGLSIVATAIVAVGFQPVRERVQRVANRLVYGKRATPYEVLSQFSERVAESYAADEVMPRMARVLAEGTGAQRADVWLRGRNMWLQSAVWPVDMTLHDPVAAVDGELPAGGPGERVIAVRHQGDLLGALSITKRAGESLTPVEENLVTHLAEQAGLVLRNVGLTTDLQARLEELRASRQRLVTAQDEERRKLERNLHDGAQQHLVALKVKLGLAEMLMTRDPEKAKATLTQLKGDADEALETLRDLARGIYPPLLAEKGLAVALESQARKATVPVTVDAAGITRYSQDLEAAVYFCCLEALQNIQKYAGASRAAIRLRDLDGLLGFEVIDDGAGFDKATTTMGSGLTNMVDRLDALDGSVEVISSPGAGTTLRGRLPVLPARVLVPA
jgi:signal transduction histidine kinase